MKKLLLLVLLAMVTGAAYADKNAKANNVKPSNAAPADTAGHGAGKELYEFRQRDYDTRMGRYMPVDIDSATAAKY